MKNIGGEKAQAPHVRDKGKQNRGRRGEFIGVCESLCRTKRDLLNRQFRGGGSEAMNPQSKKSQRGEKGVQKIKEEIRNGVREKRGAI